VGVGSIRARSGRWAVRDRENAQTPRYRPGR
jgi:hypothetical protein